MKHACIVIAAIAVIMAGAAVGAGAQQALSPTGLEDSLGAALQEMAASPLGTLTVGDLARLAARLSIAEQQDRYIQRARNASWHFPGAGQFMTGDTAGGSLFLAGDLAVIGGTLVGAYFLLPSNVQFSSLDYFNDPLSTIRSRWEGNSVVNYLPSFGVLVGGMIVKHILGHFASVEAEKRARQNIADGKVTFTPNLEFLEGRRAGFGMRMSY
jgi:hypothetical protein